jgi:hypothetical protein
LPLFSGPRFGHISVEARLDIVEMIENAAYIICGEDHVNVGSPLMEQKPKFITHVLIIFFSKKNFEESSIVVMSETNCSSWQMLMATAS